MKKISKKSFAIILFILLLLSNFQNICYAWLEFGSSPNPVGSGARALGMGGAFIAITDDATSASWNPGGLIQLETPEISFVGAYFKRKEANDSGTNPEINGVQSISDDHVNYFSISYPFSLFSHNMIISLSYQHLYDFSRDWSFPLNTDDGVVTLNNYYIHQQEGGLFATGIAYCIQMTPKLSFGFTLNFWNDWFGDNEWSRSRIISGSGFTPFDTIDSYPRDKRDKYSFDGFNTNFGILWNVNNKITIGAVFKTPFTADLEHTHSNYETLVWGSAPPDIYIEPPEKSDGEMDMPMSYGIGIAYRFSDQFTASADIYRTEWQDFVMRDYYGETSPISGIRVEDSEVEATNQVRIGAEYLIIKPKYVIPIRGGLFYDPAPSEEGSDDFFGISIGSGIALGRYIFDIAYQYRFGNDVGSSMFQGAEFTQDVDEHTVYSSLIVHF